MRETPEVEIPLARAVVARVLKLWLHTPGPRAMKPLECAEGCRALQRAAAVLEEEAQGPLHLAVERVLGAGLPPLETLRAEHERLFGHTLRGRVCPYETEYGSGALFQQSQELADISGFYLAFGLAFAPEGSVRLDHIGCELEFVEFLCLKEAWAVEAGNQEMEEVTRQALRKFTRDHIGRFGMAFAAALRTEAAGGFYEHVGAVCLAFLNRLCESLEVRPGPERIELRPEDDEVPMACGTEPLIQIAPRKTG